MHKYACWRLNPSKKTSDWRGCVQCASRPGRGRTMAPGHTTARLQVVSKYALSREPIKESRAPMPSPDAPASVPSRWSITAFPACVILPQMNRQSCNVFGGETTLYTLQPNIKGGSLSPAILYIIRVEKRLSGALFAFAARWHRERVCFTSSLLAAAPAAL